jgi:hypothetical protein
MESMCSLLIALNGSDYPVAEGWHNPAEFAELPGDEKQRGRIGTDILLSMQTRCKQQFNIDTFYAGVFVDLKYRCLLLMEVERQRAKAG